MWDKFRHSSNRMGITQFYFVTWTMSCTTTTPPPPLLPTHPSSLLSLGFNCRSSPNRNMPLRGIISLHWQNFSTWLTAHKMRSVRAAASFPRSAASTPFYSAALLHTRHLAEPLLTELTLFGRTFIRIYFFFSVSFFFFPVHSPARGTRGDWFSAPPLRAWICPGSEFWQTTPPKRRAVRA